MLDVRVEEDDDEQSRLTGALRRSRRRASRTGVVASGRRGSPVGVTHLGVLRQRHRDNPRCCIPTPAVVTAGDRFRSDAGIRSASASATREAPASAVAGSAHECGERRASRSRTAAASQERARRRGTGTWPRVSAWSSACPGGPLSRRGCSAGRAGASARTGALRPCGRNGSHAAGVHGRIVTIGITCRRRKEPSGVSRNESGSGGARQVFGRQASFTPRLACLAWGWATIRLAGRGRLAAVRRRPVPPWRGVWLMRNAVLRTQVAP